MAFSAIHPVPGLSEPAYRESLRHGPPAVGLRRKTYPELLSAAGFDVVRSLDVTAEYRQARADALAHDWRLLGDVAGDDREAVRERVKRGRTGLRMVDAGLQRRTLFLARPR